MEVEYGKLVKLLEKTFMGSFIPDEKSSLEELTSNILEEQNGEYSFDLENLLETKDDHLKSYFASLLPQSMLDDDNQKRAIIESYEEPCNIIEYGLPQVCLENLYDSKFREKLEEKNEFFKSLRKEDRKRYYNDFNLVSIFLEKASRMWSIEYKLKKNKIVGEKFIWTGYQAFTSRNQVISNNELKTSVRTEVGVFEKSIYSIYETYAQGEYSKLHIGQKYSGDKSKEIELWNQSLEKYIELAFEIIFNKLNEYRRENDKHGFEKYGPVIRLNCNSETESDIKNYQIDKIVFNLQKYNDYLPWDLYDNFTKHNSGKDGSLLETLYNDCRFAPAYYKSAELEELFTRNEQDFINEKYKEIYSFLANNLSEDDLAIIYEEANGLFVSPELIKGIFDKIETLSFLEDFSQSNIFKNIISEKVLEDNSLLNLFIKGIKDEEEYVKWTIIRDKWQSDNTSILNPNGSTRERSVAAGMDNDNLEYVKDYSSETLDDEKLDTMFSEEKETELEENEESEEFYEDNEEIENMPDFDNESADQDFGMEGIESNIADDSMTIDCRSAVEGKIKGIFNNYFSSNRNFKKFMNKWCEYALDNYKADENLSNFENEYNAIISAFDKFGDNTDFSKNVDKFLRQVKKAVALTDEQIAEYKKSFTALRREFKEWFERARK